MRGAAQRNLGVMHVAATRAHSETSRKDEETLDGNEDGIPSIPWSRKARAVDRGASGAAEREREAKVLYLLIALPALPLLCVFA